MVSKHVASESFLDDMMGPEQCFSLCLKAMIKPLVYTDMRSFMFTIVGLGVGVGADVGEGEGAGVGGGLGEAEGKGVGAAVGGG